MPFIQNGSGLWIPENIFRPKNFSVPDGTGYVPIGKKSCLHTGFTTNDDRLIYPLGPWSVSSAGYWSTPPVDASHVAANATVSTWMPSVSFSITDQWCTSAVTNLVEAGGTGAGIGVMCRVNASGNGYYGMIAKFGGVLRYEAGVFNGTPTAKFVAAASLSSITLKVVGNTISMYIGSPDTSLTLISSFNDSGHTTGVPGAIASSGSNGHPDTFQTQTNWLAGEIGGC